VPPPDPVTGGRPGFAELFAGLPVAVLVVDPDDRVAHANGAAEQLLNLSERLMLGQRLDAVIERPAGAEGHDLAVYDADVRTTGGARLRVNFAESHVAHRPGWRTITLHGTAGARLGRPGERASGARAAMGAAAMLAHEIKNPLSGIRGAAQLLGPGELTRLIVTEVDRVAALIDRMQDFTDTRPLPCAPENIYPLLGHARTAGASCR